MRRGKLVILLCRGSFDQEAAKEAMMGRRSISRRESLSSKGNNNKGVSVYRNRENRKKERILVEEERVVSSFAGWRVITSLPS